MHCWLEQLLLTVFLMRIDGRRVLDFYCFMWVSLFGVGCGIGRVVVMYDVTFSSIAVLFESSPG